MKYVIALDQGTTSSRAVIFDETGRMVAAQGIEFEQIYPKPGWVEHDPKAILESQISAVRLAVELSGIDVKLVEAVGITNQRETTLLWDRKTGETVSNAIVWQCRRTAPIVERLKRDGLGSIITNRTGLIPDAYFSGTKLEWLLENVEGARERAERGELCFGTVDSYLTYMLTKEKRHVTDMTNASRTMLYNIFEKQWDAELLKMMDIPEKVLPEVVDSSGIVGTLDKSILGREIPVAALAGDQHAALFGQGCFTPGMCKNTYGTGCFVLMNTGRTPVRSPGRLLTTVGWCLDGRVTYALEGSVFVAGAVVKWLRDEMNLIKNAAETADLAASVPDNAGVYFVPAFTGLGAPTWDMYARGLIVGLTRGAGRAHVVRAALEAIAYQSADVICAMQKDSGISMPLLRVDGGASANDFLMQFQADILGAEVIRPSIIESTALGAAMLAGRAVGLWSDADMAKIQTVSRTFSPKMDGAHRERLLREWKRAVARAEGWAEE
jgi:glycerol kinase